MPGRSYNANSYRYGGAGGQEKVDEISGVGNHYTAAYWEYDPRLGKRWNTDPVFQPWQSPYATFNNNPIYYIDPDGRVALGAIANKIGSFFKNIYNKVKEAVKGDKEQIGFESGKGTPENPIQGPTFEITAERATATTGGTSFWNKVGNFAKNSLNFLDRATNFNIYGNHAAGSSNSIEAWINQHKPSLWRNFYLNTMWLTDLFKSGFFNTTNSRNVVKTMDGKRVNKSLSETQHTTTNTRTRNSETQNENIPTDLPRSEKSHNPVLNQGNSQTTNQAVEKQSFIMHINQDSSTVIPVRVEDNAHNRSLEKKGGFIFKKDLKGTVTE
jgi:hypothetical protein